MILFINGCVREASRTLELAKAVLDRETDVVQEVSLYSEGPEGLNEEKLYERDKLLKNKDYKHPVFRWARQFAEADTIVHCCEDAVLKRKSLSCFDSFSVPEEERNSDECTCDKSRDSRHLGSFCHDYEDRRDKSYDAYLG